MSKTRSILVDIYPEYDQLTQGQQKILASALDLFSKKGYAGTSTNSIAKDAGVGEGLIFKHFRNKKNLFLKLVQPLALKVFFPLSLRRVKGIVTQEYSLLDELLESFLRERIEFITNHQELARIVCQEVWLQEELREKLRESFMQQIGHHLEQQFLKFQEQGAIRAMSFHTFLRLVLSNFLGYIIPRVLFFPEADWNDQEEIRQTILTLVQGLKPD